MLAVTVAVGAGVGSARAQAPAYGGGVLPQASPPRGYTPTLGITLRPSGDRLALRFDTTLRCGRSTYDVAARRTVPFDGASIAASGAGRLRLVGGRVRFAWSIAGRVDGQTATGVLRIDGVRTVGARRRTCSRRAERPFEARVPVAPAGAPGLPSSRAVYLGLSAHRLRGGFAAPVIVRASRNGRKVAARWTAEARCRNGGRVRLVNFTPPTGVRTDATFRRRERFTQRFVDLVIRYRVAFAGRIAADGATGTLRLRASVYDPRRGNELITRCDTRRHAWTAVPGNPDLPPAAPTPPAAPSPPPPEPPGEPRRPIPGAWSLTMTSDSGDYIGQGQSWSHGPPETISVTGTPELVSFRIDTADGLWWSGDFASGPGRTLVAGTTYAGATRYPFNDGTPGLDISGMGRGCNELSGTFTVDEIAFDPDGTLRTFRVRFEQHCEHSAAPALRGTFAFAAA
jgi:hypothetical protein